MSDLNWLDLIGTPSTASADTVLAGLLSALETNAVAMNISGEVGTLVVDENDGADGYTMYANPDGEEGRMAFRLETTVRASDQGSIIHARMGFYAEAAPEPAMQRAFAALYQAMLDGVARYCEAAESHTPPEGSATESQLISASYEDTREATYDVARATATKLNIGVERVDGEGERAVVNETRPGVFEISAPSEGVTTRFRVVRRGPEAEVFAESPMMAPNPMLQIGLQRMLTQIAGLAKAIGSGGPSVA